MDMVEELAVCDQVFHGAFERCEYEKALAAVTQCKQLAEALYHSDLCDIRSFKIFHRRWDYYRNMEREIRTIVRRSGRGRGGGFLSRLFG